MIMCTNKKGASNHVWYEKVGKETVFFFIFYGMKNIPLLLASEMVLHRRPAVALQEQVKENIALYSSWSEL